MQDIHPVFHVNLLREFTSSKIEGQYELPPLPIKIQNEDEYKVNEVLNKRRIRGKIEYLVSGKGYASNHDLWEPEKNLMNAQDVVKEFNDKYPDAEKKYLRTQRR